MKKMNMRTVYPPLEDWDINVTMESIRRTGDKRLNVNRKPKKAVSWDENKYILR